MAANTYTKIWQRPLNWDGNYNLNAGGGIDTHGRVKYVVTLVVYGGGTDNETKKIILAKGDFYGGSNAACRALIIDKIEFHVTGLQIQLDWDMDPAQLVAILPAMGTGTGSGNSGKLLGPYMPDLVAGFPEGDAGGYLPGETGDLLITTRDMEADAVATIQLHFRVKE